MAKIYYRSILSGAITFEDVPDKYKEAVRELLDNSAS